MVSAFHVGLHPGIDLVFGSNVRARLDFAVAIPIKSRLPDDFPGQADASAKTLAIGFVVQIVELELRLASWIAGLGANPPPGLGFVGADVDLKPVPVKCRVAVIAHDGG